MTAIVSVFWRICIFKTGPDVIPANNFLLGFLIALNILISWTVTMVLQALVPISPEITNQLDEREIAALSDGFLLFARILVNLASTAALTWGILTLMGHPGRVNKVLCGIFGCDILLTALTFVFVAIAQALSPQLAQFAMLATFLWSIAVYGFILHRGLNISVGFGISASLFIMIFSFAVSQVALAQ